MFWTAPFEIGHRSPALVKHPWDAADLFCANFSPLFLRFTNDRLAVQCTKLKNASAFPEWPTVA